MTRIIWGVVDIILTIIFFWLLFFILRLCDKADVEFFWAAHTADYVKKGATFLKHPEVAIPVITAGATLISSPFIYSSAKKHYQIKKIGTNFDLTKEEIKNEGLWIVFKNICEEKEMKNPSSKGEWNVIFKEMEKSL